MIIKKNELIRESLETFDSYSKHFKYSRSEIKKCQANIRQTIKVYYQIACKDENSDKCLGETSFINLLRSKIKDSELFGPEFISLHSILEAFNNLLALKLKELKNLEEILNGDSNGK